MNFVIQFVILLIIAVGVSTFLVKVFMFSSSDNVVKRLEDDIAKSNAKQAELGRKIKEAEEELEKKRTEARDLANKLRLEAEQETKIERDKIVGEARKEGEEIIRKAQIATEKMKKEMEREFDMYVLQHSMKILSDVLSEKAKGEFDKLLIEDFLKKLETVDVSQIEANVTKVEAISLNVIDKPTQDKISDILKKRLNRALSITASTDNKLGGGVMLKFGTMALDGTLKNEIRSKAIKLQEEVTARII